jgi:hypothetical protein
MSTLYAAFPGADRAALAVRSLRSAPWHGNLIVHRGHIDSEKLPLAQTSSTRRALQGAVAGVLLGGALGLLLWASNLAGGEPMLALVFAAFIGMVVGALGGVLAGAASPVPQLEHLDKKVPDSGVVLIVEAPDEESIRRAARVFAEHGAQLER